ncbi:MAG: AAA family ATPase [Planctomycetes bacterium]|nr:AAA family ATPase [Planctomycetota bacterium]
MSQAFHCVEASELEETPEPKRWIWDGFLHPGQVTLLTSMWKSGKTTLLSHLLAQRRTGGMLAGRAVSAGVNVVVTEEPRNRWHERHARLRFGPRDCFIYRPFVGVPSQGQWLDLLHFLQGTTDSRGADLVIIDPLSRFLPSGAESHPRLLLDALGPLNALTQRGMAILLVHHPRKASAGLGMLSRGTGSLPSFVDFLIEMYRVSPHDPVDRRRRLVSVSRDPATPASLVIELAADSSGYAVIDDAPDDEFLKNWIPLRIVLENAEKELTRQQIRAAWPNSFPAPARNTLYLWLNNALDRDLVQRVGKGTRMDPFRYFLPGMPTRWNAPPEKPTTTPNVDAWIKEWDKKYPTPPERPEEHGIEDDHSNGTGDAA